MYGISQFITKCFQKIVYYDSETVGIERLLLLGNIPTDFHKNPNTSKELSHFVHIIGSDMGTVMEEMIKISTKTINVILPFLPFENNVSSSRILLC